MIRLWPTCSFRTASEVVTRYATAYPHEIDDPFARRIHRRVRDRPRRRRVGVARSVGAVRPARLQIVGSPSGRARQRAEAACAARTALRSRCGRLRRGCWTRCSSIPGARSRPTELIERVWGDDAARRSDGVAAPDRRSTAAGAAGRIRSGAPGTATSSRCRTVCCSTTTSRRPPLRPPSVARRTTDTATAFDAESLRLASSSTRDRRSSDATSCSPPRSPTPRTGSARCSTASPATARAGSSRRSCSNCRDAAIRRPCSVAAPPAPAPRSVCSSRCSPTPSRARACRWSSPPARRSPSASAAAGSCSGSTTCTCSTARRRRSSRNS